MTKIIVFSDSHGAKANIDKLINENNFDYLIFLGDGLNDLNLYENLPNLKKVRGNCDYFSFEKDELFLKLENKNILITHGNNYGVKRGLGALIKYAYSIDANIVLYGHTHRFAIDEINNIYFLNPGSLKSGSAMLLEINNNDIKIKALNI